VKLGIMGGTFDPIHNGHLIIAQEAGWRLGLSRVLFIPAGDPPHKQTRAITPVDYRLEMVRLATAGNPLFEVSTIEIERAGLSYTADTLAELHKLYGPKIELFFIIGADAAADLLSWHEPEKVLQLARLVVAERPGYSLPFDKLKAGLPHINLADRLLSLDVPMIEIASQELRARIAQGAPIKYLVPDAVVEYIAQEKLYLDKAESDLKC
jgi:nicotinate-nucleotide adenylyltransferase